jgi:hypothetical protein
MEVNFYELPKDEQEYIISTGMALYKLECNYPVTCEELIGVCKDATDYISQTRLTNIRLILFTHDINGNEVPRSME